MDIANKNSKEVTHDQSPIYNDWHIINKRNKKNNKEQQKTQSAHAGLALKGARHVTNDTRNKQHKFGSFRSVKDVTDSQGTPQLLSLKSKRPRRENDVPITTMLKNGPIS